MNRPIYGIMVVTVTLWKAVLVLMIASDDKPMSMLLGEIPGTYVSESDCNSFAANQKHNVARMAKDLISQGVSVIDGRMVCVQDESGEVT